MIQSPQDILDFWFSETAKKRWFNSTDAFDSTLAIKFEATAKQLAGENDLRADWEAQGPQAHLALILALDQIPRNIYRGTAGMFEWDALALASAKRLVASGGDLHLSQVERPFAYMPYMHSEDLMDQDDCIRLCEARLEDDNTLKFAKIHRDIIARFGRFPHRNKILGREMTAEEQSFLDNGGFSG